jgi:tRNA(fMet)-specific endonuclease VapC
VAGKVLLDTSVAVELFGQTDVAERLRAVADEVFTPSIVLGELFFGALKSTRVVANLAQVEALAASTHVLACDFDTARHYGEIRIRLRNRGRPIPDNDIWIAAVARQHDLTLATRDGHFRGIEDLTVVEI